MSTAEHSAANDLWVAHADLVYAAALRQTRDAHVAADITQAVFIVALRKGQENKLPEDHLMSGWLLKVVYYAVKEANRAAARRAYHERVAGRNRAQVLEEVSVDIEEIDVAILSLRPLDREALIRRYLQGHSVASIAVALSLSENTASKRIVRALEKLRQILSRRGAVLSLGTLTAFLAAQSVIKAPLALASVPAGIGVPMLVKHLLGSFFMVKPHVILVATIILLVAIGAGSAAIYFHNVQAVPAEVGSSAPPAASSTHPGQSPYAQPYIRIFSKMVEKQDSDLRIEVMRKKFNEMKRKQVETGVVDPAAPTVQEGERILLHEQVVATVALWNRMEQATREVATRHNLSVAALDDAPPLPTDLSGVTVQQILIAINNRMVIPLGAQTEQEVLDLCNARYKASLTTTASSQPAK